MEGISETETGVVFFVHHWACILGHRVGDADCLGVLFGLGSREVGVVGFICLCASPRLGWHAGALVVKDESVLVVLKVSCSVCLVLTTRTRCFCWILRA